MSLKTTISLFIVIFILTNHVSKGIFSTKKKHQLICFLLTIFSLTKDKIRQIQLKQQIQQHQLNVNLCFPSNFDSFQF